VQGISLVDDDPNTRGKCERHHDRAGQNLHFMPLFPWLGAGKKNSSKKNEHTTTPLGKAMLTPVA
jgi:hypothetical protein